MRKQQGAKPFRRLAKPMRKLRTTYVLLGLLMMYAQSSHAEITGNAGISNNYIWRGLTQTTNEPAISGGIDYTHSSGFYAGTWASNVQYAADDIFSYEHDVYFGYSGGETITWDVGWLYYNYDSEAEFDFHELYGTHWLQGVFSFSELAQWYRS